MEDFMDFKQLETFITIVKTKSFTKTADVLYITQPSVTNHIQALESELNTSLFVRTRRSVTLTQAGSIVYKHALNILASYDEIIRDLDIYSQNLKGTLNICVSSVPRKIILPNLIEKFSNLFPDISFNISNDDSRTVIDSILVGETDFGIVGLKISNPKLIYTQIMDDHIVYVVNKDAYPDLKNYSVINIEDLSNDKIILREIGSGTRQIVEDELKRNNSLNVISNSVATIHDTNTILELISKGVGSGFISQRMLNISPYKDSVKIEQLGGFDTLSLSKVGNDYVELDFKNKLDPKNKWKISMTVTPKKDYVGSIMATFDGKGVDKASTNIADVYDGINFVNRVPDQITLGLQDQAIKTFSLLESMPGSLAKGDYTLRVNPAYKGFSFTSAKVLAKTGNIDVKSLSIDKDNIKFSVKSESTRPSEIEFSNVTASIDRFGYDGTYKLELVNNNDTNSVIASIDLFNVNAATPVTTPTNNALDIKFVIGSKDYTVNKEAKTLDVAPYIAKGNRTMLPVRAVAESLKMNVAWNEADKTITLTKTDNSKKIILTLGSKAMFVDGEKVTLDSAPEIKDSRTFLPVAQIANAVGVDTGWDAQTKTVTLTK